MVPTAHTSYYARGIFVTGRIVDDSVSKHHEKGWPQPQSRWEIAPYASVVSRIGERERWLGNMSKKDCDTSVDSFAAYSDHRRRWWSCGGGKQAGSQQIEY